MLDATNGYAPAQRSNSSSQKNHFTRCKSVLPSPKIAAITLIAAIRQFITGSIIFQWTSCKVEPGLGTKTAGREMQKLRLLFFLVKTDEKAGIVWIPG